MEVFTIKVVGGILLWACMVIFGLLPIYNTRFKTNSRLLSLCNCFCGGLFLAIGLVHILPEAHEMLDEKIEPTKTNDNILVGCGEGGIQWSYLICLMSFSSILLLEKVIFNNSDLTDENGLDHDHGEQMNLKKSILNSSIRNSLIEDSDNIENNFKERVSCKYKLALRLSNNSNLNGSFVKNRDDDFEEFDMMVKKPKLKIFKSNEKGDEEEKLEDIQETSSDMLKESLLSDKNNLEIQNQKNKEIIQKSMEKPSLKVTMISEGNNDEQVIENEKIEGHHHHNLVKKDDSLLTCVILLVAMGIHGFFALLAFGIEPSKAGTVNLFIALIVHKWSEALTVGKLL